MPSVHWCDDTAPQRTLPFLLFTPKLYKPQLGIGRRIEGNANASCIYSRRGVYVHTSELHSNSQWKLLSQPELSRQSRTLAQFPALIEIYWSTGTCLQWRKQEIWSRSHKVSFSSSIILHP